jgi:hypothetical protein
MSKLTLYFYKNKEHSFQHKKQKSQVYYFKITSVLRNINKIPNLNLKNKSFLLIRFLSIYIPDILYFNSYEFQNL